jgi:hypothetical protein
MANHGLHKQTNIGGSVEVFLTEFDFIYLNIIIISSLTVIL